MVGRVTHPFEDVVGRRGVRYWLGLLVALSLTGVSACASAPLAASARHGDPTYPVPPVPHVPPEFFRPTYTEHRVDARCAPSTMELRWAFDERGLRLTSLRFDGVEGAPGEVAKINGWLGRFPDKAVGIVACNNEGAVIAFVEVSAMGNRSPKMVKFSWVDERATLLGYYNF